MQLQKIMFPTDFSHTGDAALAFATSLARDMKARLVIVHVEEPPIAYAGGEFYYGIPNPTPGELQEMLSKVRPTDPEVSFEHRLITGSPASAIARLAADENIDLIVIGTHGRTGMSRLLMGSVAEEIVRKAPCPVLTYKAKHQDK